MRLTIRWMRMIQMDLQKVKSNMLGVTISISSLETKLKQFESRVNGLDIKNIDRMVNYTKSTIGDINSTGLEIDRMYKLNKQELHIFFREYNDESEKVMGSLMSLAENVKQLGIECMRISMIAGYLDQATYDFKVELIDIKNMKRYFSKEVSKTYQVLRNFRNSTSIHNQKLS